MSFQANFRAIGAEMVCARRAQMCKASALGQFLRNDLGIIES
jgi:hypothetical protein